MRIDNNSWLLTSPIAHRGLWGGRIIENSLPAYQNAINSGYPIEIDIYQSNDGELFSFHDKTLKRMTGADGFIFEKTSKELKELRLSNSTETIPTLKEVLSLVDGKVPLLIEFKDQPDKTFVKNAVDILKNYKGEFAVQSFNPLIIKEIKKLAPSFIRGVLTTSTHAKEESKTVQFVLKHMPFNFLIKPDFISCAYEDLEFVKRKSKRTPVIAWTITSKEIQNNLPPFVKNIIFENYIPR